MAVVGELALWVALFLSIWGAAASFASGATGRPELGASGARAIFAASALLVLAALGLWTALLSHDFSIEFVASHTTMNTPALYLVTAFWAGADGALLGWSLMLAFGASIAVTAARRRSEEAAPWIAGALAGTLALSLALICFMANPYRRLESVPSEGQGLAPHLQTPLAALHFVAIYAAYAAAAVALVLAVVATVRGARLDERSLGALRGWSLTGWCLLTIGIAVRMRWAYVEPVLGGLWSWDPGEVANAVLWVAGGVLLRALFSRDTQRRAATAGARRRAAGWYAIYVGVAFLLAGAASTLWWTERTVRLRPGEAAELPDPYGRRWRFVSQGASRDEQVNYSSTGVALEAWRAGASAGIINAERRQYLDSTERPTGAPAAKPGIRSGAGLDVYVLLAGLRDDTAELRVGFRPLIAATWIGWALVVLGALVTAAESTALLPRGRADARRAAAA